MKYILTTIGLAQFALWYYTIELLRRTHFAKISTSIGLDVICIFYFLAVSCVSAAAWSFHHKPDSKLLSGALLISAGIVLSVFLYLNMTGKVGRWSKLP
jgi:hypothetical protein